MKILKSEKHIIINYEGMKNKYKTVITLKVEQ